MTPEFTKHTRTVIAIAFTALIVTALCCLPASATAYPRGGYTEAPPQATTSNACLGADAPAVDASKQALRAAVVCLVNQRRAVRHLPALHASPLLDRSAQEWTNAMVRGDFFSHGSNFASRITAVGFIWSSAGENIATGFSTPRSVVNAWMASAGHCRNILSPMFADVGTGVNPSGVSGYGSAATWTQDFALPQGHHAPSRNWGPADGCPY